MCVADTRKNVEKISFVNHAVEVLDQKTVLPST